VQFVNNTINLATWQALGSRELGRSHQRLLIAACVDDAASVVGFGAGL